MTITEQKQAAKKFVKRWQSAEGNEQRESNSFWSELCQEVLGIPNPTHVLDFERKVRGKRIDVFYEDHSILIENKSRGVDLDKKEQRGKNNDGSPRMVTPYEQARWYADYITPRSVAPKYILTCNFDEIRIYDTDEEYPEKTFETIRLEELPQLFHRLSFFTQKENSRAEREKNLSVSAGEVVGKLYDAFSKSYLDIENNEEEQRSLNMLITRIVFLLYAEDSGNLKVRNQFYNYMNNYQTAHMRNALRDLFLVLNTEEDKRDPYLPEELADFPYINGGLFKDEIIIPQFTDEARYILLKEASSEFNWANISPTIFGAVFESTLTAKKRREGGMHYTSVENIHRVTGPLFYDELKDELTTIEGIKTHKERQFKLRQFRKKLASIHVLDPACGSGNFLTETYLSFRKLENRILEDLRYDQVEGQMTLGQMEPIMVSLDQFYGIEIDDFAVSVAKTALWIAQLQMTLETSEVMGEWIAPLPLKSNDNIVCGNALRMDWNDVLPAEKCDYIIGNPPFRGANGQTKEQKKEVQTIFEGHNNSSLIDYVACWYKVAWRYMQNSTIHSAFVSTNSINQGEQVANIWEPLFNEGLRFEFAHNTFRWSNEASDQAHVFVVIIGFCHIDYLPDKIYLYDHKTPDSEAFVVLSDNINAYLNSGPIVFIRRQNNPLSDVPKMTKGCQPTDGGNLIIEADEIESFLLLEPKARPYIKKLIGSKEFIQRRDRYCLWLDGVSDEEIDSLPEVKKRVEACREFRLSSNQLGTQKLAKRAKTFRETYNPETCLIVPMVSSERRLYIPLGYIGKDTISTNLNLIVQNLGLFGFGVLQSQFHNAWMRAVAGRLENRYRYSAGVVYNNYIWPDPSEEQRKTVEKYAQEVLAARDNYPSWSFAQLYDPDEMPDDLREAHKALDAAVEAAYGVDFQGDEEKIVAHLFKLYEQAIQAENSKSPKKESKPAAVKIKIKKKAR